MRAPANRDLTAAALACAVRGWAVFPLRPGDKRPAVHGQNRCPRSGACAGGHLGWEQRATTDPDRIYRCWRSGGFNVGLAAGRSRLVVVDLDIPKPGNQPPANWQIDGVGSGEDVLALLAERAGASYADALDTFVVRTARGGLHLYFTAPVDMELHNSSGRLGWLIDTRANGGYVVAAGSVVNGRRYEIVNDRAPAPLPAWITERLTADDHPATADPARATRIIRSGADRRTAYANAALTAEVKRVLEATEGARNDTLVRAAFALGQLVGDGLLPEPVVTTALDAAGQATGLSARECAATIRSGLRSGLAHPRTGGAA